MLDTIGAGRGVLVQPTFYGTTVDALTDALRQARGSGRWTLRGIGAATAEVSDAGLHAMHDAGVRGLRFIEMPAPDGSGRYKGGVGVDHLHTLAPRMRELGWHAQLWCPAEEHAARLPALVRLGLPLVVDHMGSFTADQGVAAPAFQRLLGLLSDGLIWVKLSLCRNSRQFPDYPDLRAFHDALVRANPARLLWGSDWPHVRMGSLAPDVGHLLDVFRAWIGDAALERAILVDNPATLYDFGHGLEGPHA
jgi:predicted TIM-barrel fold metal-dependent hydrolase